MAHQKTAKFEKKLSRINHHLILTAIKNKKYTQALRAIEISFKLDKQKPDILVAPKEIPEIPLDPIQKKINELEAMAISKGWLNDP
jgi:hypothetical protein